MEPSRKVHIIGAVSATLQPSRPEIPVALNAALAGALLTLHAGVLIALPLARGAGWPALALALATPALWSLVHEAIHGSMHPARRINRALGRALGVAFGAPFAMLQLGHLLHHRFNRTPSEPAEAFDPAVTPRVRAAARYYLRLLGGLYVFLAASCVLFLLPKRWIVALADRLAAGDPLAAPIARTLTRPRELAAIRADSVATLAFYGAAFALYGTAAAWLAAALALRALWISLNDNVYHYGTPAGARRHGLNLRAPAAVRWLLLDFNLHGIHHADPACPWTGLARRFEASGHRYDGGLAAALAAQLRGPLPAAVPQASSPSASASR